MVVTSRDRGDSVSIEGPFRIYDVMTFELDVEELRFFVFTTIWIVIRNHLDCNAAVVLKDQEGSLVYDGSMTWLIRL